jgi:hypothetical protein
MRSSGKKSSKVFELKRRRTLRSSSSLFSSHQKYTFLIGKMFFMEKKVGFTEGVGVGGVKPAYFKSECTLLKSLFD